METYQQMETILKHVMCFSCLATVMALNGRYLVVVRISVIMANVVIYRMENKSKKLSIAEKFFFFSSYT